MKMLKRLGRVLLAAACILLSLSAVQFALAESIAEGPVILLNGQPVEQVEMNLTAGDRLQFESNQPVQWKSSKPYRAEIDANGLLTSKTIGKLIISATAADGRKATCEVVMTRLAGSITISGPDSLAAGKRGTLKATVLPSNAKNRRVKWSSSDESVVTVSSSGRITARDVDGIRSAVITATAQDGSGVVAQHTVTVRPAARSVTVFADGQPVEEVYLDISAGQPTIQLSASVAPAEAGQQVTWKSSGTRRVTVDENGLVTGLAAGTATVTVSATDGTSRRATVKVRVVRMVTGIELSGENSVLSGKRVTLDAKVYPKNATTRTLIWESSDPSVATVDKYGRVRAQTVDSKKTVTITARAKDGSGVYAQHTLTVTPRIASLTILAGGKPVTDKLVVDMDSATVDLNALIEPADAQQNVKWSVSSSSRAKVDENGVVTGLKPGSVRVTAKAQDGSGKKATVTIEFVRMVKKITLTGADEVTGGRGATLKTVFEPEKPTNRKVVWESSNPDILSVSKSGTLRAAKVTSRQTVTIYAKAQDGSGVVGSKTITVTPRASAVTILRDGAAAEKAGVDLGGSKVLQLTAKVGPEDASQAVVWTTSNNKRATVDQNGLVTGLRAGTVTITAKAADGTGVKAKITVNVGLMVRKVTISGAAQVSSGDEVRLTASVAPSAATKKGVVWSSSNEAVAKVNKYGLVTGGQVDTPTQVTIYATAEDGGGAVGAYTMTVVPVARSISISRTDAKMAGTLILAPGGAKARLSASVYPAAAQQKVRWRSSNEAIVTVDAAGNVVSHETGRALIYAEATDGSGVKATLWVGVGNLSEIPYYFEVDRANQVVRVYERGADNTYTTLIKRMICSTGKSYTPGLDDTLHSLNGGRMVWMDGVAVYATRIKGHFLFHSVIYETKNMGDLDSDAYMKLGTKASGGCVRLLAGDAKWIYDNVPKGCFVNFVAGTRDVNEFGSVTLPPLKSGHWDPTNPQPNNPDFDPTYSSDVK